MPGASEPSVSGSSFQFTWRLAWPSGKTVMLLLLAIFLALHVIAGWILQDQTQGRAARAQEEKTISLYD
jgi:hypothetical protein